MNSFEKFLKKNKIDGIKSIELEGSRDSPDVNSKYNSWNEMLADAYSCEGDTPPFFIIREDSVSVKSLGEFYFNCLVNRMKSDYKVKKDLMLYSGERYSWKKHIKLWIKNFLYDEEEVLACLGEAEIIERLKEVQE